MGIQKYRIVWKFSDAKFSKDKLNISSLPIVDMCDEVRCNVTLNVKALPSGNSAFMFFVKIVTKEPIEYDRIKNWSYYMINERTGEKYIFEKLSPFESVWNDFGFAYNGMEFVMVFAMDYNKPKAVSQLVALKGATTGLNNFVMRRSVDNLINGKQYRLIRSSSNDKFWISGLESNEFVLATIDGCLKIVRPCETASFLLRKPIVMLHAIFAKFEKIDAAHYFEIGNNFKNIEISKPLQNNFAVETGEKLLKDMFKVSPKIYYAI